MSDKEQPAYLGHRERVRQRIEEFGFDNLTDSDLLEYLLFFAIPRCDTYSISRRLTAEFGGLKGVFDATAEELCEIKGIGKESALFLTSFIPAFKAYHAGSFVQKKPFAKVSEILTFLRVQVMGVRSENFVVMYLDPRNCLIRHEIFSSDDWKIVSISVEKLLRKAISLKAASVVIGHNHLTGNLFPSNEDIESTSILHGKFDTIGVKLVDSIIFDDYDFYSFKEKGIIN